MNWKEFITSAGSLLEELSKDELRMFNDHISLKLDSYYFVLNCITTDIEQYSDDFTRVLGYSHKEFSFEKLIQIVHPDDAAIFMAHEQLALKFCLNTPIEKQKQFKTVHDFRIRKKSGAYIRVMQQAVAYELTDTCVLKTLVHHFDISTIKSSEVCQLHFIDQLGKETVYNVTEETVLQTPASFSLTKREREILYQLDKGYNSEQIAENLFISVHTVRTHRKNLLNKTNSENTIELLQKVKAMRLI